MSGINAKLNISNSGENALDRVREFVDNLFHGLDASPYFIVRDPESSEISPGMLDNLKKSGRTLKVVTPRNPDLDVKLWIYDIPKGKSSFDTVITLDPKDKSKAKKFRNSSVSQLNSNIEKYIQEMRKELNTDELDDWRDPNSEYFDEGTPEVNELNKIGNATASERIQVSFKKVEGSTALRLQAINCSKITADTYDIVTDVISDPSVGSEIPDNSEQSYLIVQENPETDLVVEALPTCEPNMTDIITGLLGYASAMKVRLVRYMIKAGTLGYGFTSDLNNPTICVEHLTYTVDHLIETLNRIASDREISVDWYRIDNAIAQDIQVSTSDLFNCADIECAVAAMKTNIEETLTIMRVNFDGPEQTRLDSIIADLRYA